MKKYYISYWKNFANTYNLYSVENEADAAAIEEIGECERITLKDAKKKITQEKYARKYDQAFSGYGAIYIVPASIAIDENKLEAWYQKNR